MGNSLWPLARELRQDPDGRPRSLRTVAARL